MNKYIKVYDDVLSKEQCQALINRFEDNHSQQQKESWRDVRNFTELNINQHENWNDALRKIYSVLKMNIEKYRHDCKITPLQWPDKFAFEEIRFKRYLPNNKDEFKEHVDVTTHASAKRFLVMFIYLNDNLGGHTSFSEYDTAVQPKAGRLLMFPSTWTYLHAGHKPIETSKYIIGSYLHYL